MSQFHYWYPLIGVMLLLVVLGSATVKRAPVSLAMVYLLLGWAFGRLGWLTLDPAEHGQSLELLAEIAVIVSLFSAGLKLRKPLQSRLWRLPLILASGSMAITVALIAACSMLLFGLPVGLAVLLGAILAPTDPVLASDVQVSDPGDADRLRFSLTGEAGLNDGAAFPFVMLGLGLLGLHELGGGGWRWWTVDVLWAIAGGMAIGMFLGKAVGRLVVYLRSRHLETVGYDDFLALGLIATSYGAAVALHAYGFLAVFAAGLALRTVERTMTGKDTPPDMSQVNATAEQLAVDEKHASAFMAAAVLSFNEQLERLAELALVLVTGALLSLVEFSWPVVGFALLLFLIIRPLAVGPVALAAGMSTRQAAMVSWFGIRGIGSLYYLFYALNHGVAGAAADWMIQVILCVIAASIFLHGISVTPMMRRYAKDAA
ncbi:MAG TPA: sodium:proton antiporter [Burkholderiales bacterium]